MAKRKLTSSPSESLFTEDQPDLFEKSYQERLEAEKNKPVECLGITFPNDEERRKYFLEKLRERLEDSEFRKIEGFPIGSDEDILALSDPPYYTGASPWNRTDCFSAPHYESQSILQCSREARAGC